MVLRHWLKEQNKTQAWLAEAARVTPVTVHRWVHGGIPPNRVLQINDITGISVNELLRDRL